MPVIMSFTHGGSTRYCNATCHAARKDRCACICSGKYHGIAKKENAPRNVEEANRLRELKQRQEKIEDWAEKNNERKPV